jgi:hypothetical protein
MCVLHVKSQDSPLRDFIDHSKMQIYQSHEKGELKKYRKNERFDFHGFSSVVSDRKWHDFEGQVEDALGFLKKYEDELHSLHKSDSISDIRLDFPCQCRLSMRTSFYGDYLPPELLYLAGKFGIGIELTHYFIPEDESEQTS